jgi:hypothetical protein
MASLQNQSMPREQFLLMSINLLHRAFVEAGRTEAKKLFKVLAGGEAVPLTTVQMEDRSTLGVRLCLDQSEYRGKLNYGAFRASVGTLIGNVGHTLKEENDFPVFSDESDENGMIFGITAVTVEDEQPNVMVLGVDTGGSADASVTLRLMYLDPDQFAQAS